MKTLLIILALLLTSCTSKTQYGDCIGVVDEPNPKLHYKISYWNSFVAVAFAETVIIPVYVVAKQIQCPDKTK